MSCEWSKCTKDKQKQVSSLCDKSVSIYWENNFQKLIKTFSTNFTVIFREILGIPKYFKYYLSSLLILLSFKQKPKMCKETGCSGIFHRYGRPANTIVLGLFHLLQSVTALSFIMYKTFFFISPPYPCTKDFTYKQLIY